MKNHTPALWQHILRTNFTNWEKLADFLKLSGEQKAFILQKSRFPLNLPLRLAEKIVRGCLDDPILKQFLPTLEETKISPLFIQDPVGDACAQVGPKLLHKYQGRVLLVVTGACAMHCRYCFRQNFDYRTEDKTFKQEIEWIKSDPSIHEVILSGGDPLSVSNAVLKPLIDQLNNIPHIKRIRIHSRFPIGIPERIDEGFLALLKNTPFQVLFVLHINHPKELDGEIFKRLKTLKEIGVVLLNQSVLLKGINDNLEVLTELFEMLVDHGILPYYLHQLDRVQGAAHFEVEEEKGKILIEQLGKRLPGYAIPKYVKELKGRPSKTPIL